MREVLEVDINANPAEKTTKEKEKINQVYGKKQNTKEEEGRDESEQAESVGANQSIGDITEAANYINQTTMKYNRVAKPKETKIKPCRLSNEEIAKEMRLRAARKRDVVVKNLEIPITELGELILHRTSKKPNIVKTDKAKGKTIVTLEMITIKSDIMKRKAALNAKIAYFRSKNSP